MGNFNCIELTKYFVFFALLTSKCSCDSTVYNGVPEHAIIDTEINKSENMLCRIPDEGIRICLWTHSEFGMPNKPLNLFEFMKGSTSKGNINFAYYGKGLENGDCGMQIAKMEDKYLGYWNCTLISETNKVFVASVQVKLSEKIIQKPTIELDRLTLENLLVDNKTGVVPCRNISCCAHCAVSSRPRPKMEFLLDHVPLTEYNIKTTENDTTVCLWLEAQLKIEDNGKLLQCQAHLPNDPLDELLTDSYHLNIKYSPVILPNEEPILIAVPSGAERVTISIEISGNPTPDITWHIKNVDDSDTLIVLDNGRKYNVQKKFVENNRCLVELVIKEFQKNDADYEYILNVKNEYGFKTITVKLDYEYLSNWLLIVGAVLLGLFAILTIALLVWATKTKRFCCQRRAQLPIANSCASRHTSKYSTASYKKAPTVDTVPESGDKNDTSTIPKPRSSIETEIR